MDWKNIDKIVVPVDLSEITFSAINVAMDLTATSSNIHVVHVLREINPAVSGGLLGKACVDGRPDLCRDILGGKISNEFPGVQIHVLNGEPGEGIPTFANSIRADLIVMTSYGRRGMKEHMIGSVAERVLRLAKCHVLVLKP